MFRGKFISNRCLKRYGSTDYGGFKRSSMFREPSAGSVEATFGKLDDGGLAFPGGSGRCLASDYAPESNGILTKISFRFVDSGGSFVGVVYADDGGEPGALLAVGEATAITGSGWFDSGGMSLSIVAGTTYWIGALCNDFRPEFGNGAAEGKHIAMNNSAVGLAATDPWVHDVTYSTNTSVDVYATYTVS